MRVNKKNIFLLIIIFLLGITIFIIYNRKPSLDESINKIDDAILLIETYDRSTLIERGTGFFYKKDNKYGYILTNEHIIEEGNDIQVTNSKNKLIPVELLGKDEYLDLAVLRVDKKYANKIAIINTNKKYKNKDSIFTIGFPKEKTISTGKISNIYKKIPVEVNDEEWYMKTIQINASIKPGNSGGPLLNINGEVIGIITLKDELKKNTGYAIPIEYAMNYIKYLEEGKEVKYPKLNIKLTDYNDTSTLLRNNININQDKGVVVLENKNNLKKGDLIIKVNNQSIDNLISLKYELSQYKAKDKVTLLVKRNNKNKRITITLS